MIIECKCKKFKFKIPEAEVIFPGREVQCEVCNQEWYQEFSDNASEDVNPSVLTKKNSETKVKKEKLNFSFLFYFFIFTIIISIAFSLIYKKFILLKYPNLIYFFETLEIVWEILKSNFLHFKEVITNQVQKIL